MNSSPYRPKRKLYTSELEIEDAHIDAFVNWYAFRHAPDIYQIGFDVCTSYRGVAGDMTILDLYEIESVDIFDTPQYSGEAERILLAGAKRVRLAARTKAGPNHVSHRPAYMLLVEWPQRPSLGDVGKRLNERFGGATSSPSFFVGHRLYPWVDRKDVLPR